VNDERGDLFYCLEESENDETGDTCWELESENDEIGDLCLDESESEDIGETGGLGTESRLGRLGLPSSSFVEGEERVRDFFLGTVLRMNKSLNWFDSSGGRLFTKAVSF
jgi:hypothetical protein